ncbi:hypothetical protein K7X08_037997 [Anisodus acutangulus]|uniref:Uncharacterized protein n=1 Tax=Anisodus acutangulus TaxID=402998 RepID=A0A9Q1N141_9SOLA|nr:hypothetical protein K7X08_037997 [Anisodus acutangulus]
MYVSIKKEMADRQTNVIMGQLKKFVSKEISTVLKPLKLATEISHGLRAAVQTLQVHDHVTLEDAPPTRHVDIYEFVIVHQLVEDNDSTVATPTNVRGKIKRDERDNLSDEAVERTRERV